MLIFETFKENLRKSYDELRKNLRRFSKNPRKILNSFENWARRNNSVYAKRDTHFYCCRCLSVCLSVCRIYYLTNCANVIGWKCEDEFVTSRDDVIATILLRIASPYGFARATLSA